MEFGVLVEVGEVAAVLLEGRQDLVAEAVAEGDFAAQLELILGEEAPLGGGSADVGAGDGEESGRRGAEQEVAEGVGAGVGLEGEGTEVVGGQEELDVEVAHAANVDAALEGVASDGDGEVVGELLGLRLGGAGLVAADGCEAGAGVEVEGRKGVGERMLTDVYAGEAEPLESGCAFNGEVDVGGDVGEAVAELIDDARGNGEGICETSRLRLWMESTSLGSSGLA